MSHAILPPSSAHIWSQCGGWALMNQMCPDAPGGLYAEEAAEGNAAHELAERLIFAGTKADTPGLSENDVVGQQAGNGAIFTAEMFDAARMYADVVISAMRSAGVFAGDHLGIERKVSMPGIHADVSGTPDSYVYNERAHELTIPDFKYGHDFVEVFENKQLICYYEGVRELLNLSDVDLQVVFVIVQPRSYTSEGTIRTWRVKASALRGILNQLESAANASFVAAPKYQTGSHCKNCNGRHACDAATKAGTQLYEAASLSLPAEPTLAALGTQLSVIKRALQHLKSLDTALSEITKVRIRAGENVPGWRFESTRGDVKWSSTNAEIIKMGDLMGVELRKPEAPITPTQARALAIDEAVITEYSVRTAGVKLAPIDSNQAKKVFNYE